LRQAPIENPDISLCLSCILASLCSWHTVQLDEVREEGWQVEQLPPASPWFIGNGCGPLNEAGSQAWVEWQLPQSPLKALPWEDGRLWQAEQDEGVPEKRPPWWHDSHATRACAPVNRNEARL
jgi:hypothetical protein